MRTLKVTALVLCIIALAASAAFAGGSACSASKQVQANSDKCCLSTVFAGAGNHCSASKAQLAALVDIEATRLPSGALVVMYKGKTEDAVHYLQAAAAGSVSNFCCPLTRELAAKPNAKVEIAKIAQGAIIVVNSTEKTLVDQYEQSFVTLASASH